MKPGPKAHPASRLMDAAIEFSLAVEAEGETRTAWDRLRKAALFYREAPRSRGRPSRQRAPVEAQGPHASPTPQVPDRANVRSER